LRRALESTHVTHPVVQVSATILSIGLPDLPRLGPALHPTCQSVLRRIFIQPERRRNVWMSWFDSLSPANLGVQDRSFRSVLKDYGKL